MVVCRILLRIVGIVVKRGGREYNMYSLVDSIIINKYSTLHIVHAIRIRVRSKGVPGLVLIKNFHLLLDNGMGWITYYIKVCGQKERVLKVNIVYISCHSIQSS